MLYRFIISSLIYLTAVAFEGDLHQRKQWAVLISGSNGWYNYRHQANVAHAYHILLDHGVPANQIITFAYDDIAYSDENPHPGKLFNDYHKNDYYKGFVIDYKGEDVTPEMFMRVVKGDASLRERGLKVLQSGSEDNVFLYFTDHGGPGIFVFPNDVLTALDLNATITHLHQHKMYKDLLIYLEACESGSMLKDILSPHINVYAVTSANEIESSHAAFCDDAVLDTCLSDEFSQKWMYFYTHHNIQNVTLQEEFQYIKANMFSSTPHEYGDKTIGTLRLAEFLGCRQRSPHIQDGFQSISGPKHSVPSRQTHVHGMLKTLMRASTPQDHNLAKRRMMRAIKLGELTEETMNLIVETVNARTSDRINTTGHISDILNCFEPAFRSFQSRCFSIQRVPEVAEQVRKLKMLCENGVKLSYIIAAIEKICH